jgi:ADP-glucose type glycogen/starch synthase
MSAIRQRPRPRILLCTPEITELPEGMGNAANFVRAKGGGLGDISAGLISHLYRHDRFDLHLAMPNYQAKFRDGAKLTSRELGRKARTLGRRGVHLVSDSAFSYLHDIYADSTQHPRIRRAEAFQRHVINHLLESLRPEIVHCNDWMTGLIPAAARATGIHSVFTIHNVFTELETPANIDRSGIDARRFLKHLYFERWPGDARDTWQANRVDFTASAIHAASIVNTVSPTFLAELVRGDFADVVPASIRNALRAKHATGHALGILNAPSDGVDPRLARHAARFGFADVMPKKAENKALLQRRLRLEVLPDAPVFYWPSRLYRQKAPDLLLAVASDVVARHGGQIVVIANGDLDTERRLRLLALRHRGAIVQHPFDEELSELAKAGADFVLVPSRYEPCGLPQMECPRFGTLPVVRSTGGLKDTVSPLDVDADTGMGFVFDDPTPDALAGAMAAAVAFHRADLATRARTLVRVMREAFERFSLARTAEHYVAVYDRLLDEPPPA